MVERPLSSILDILLLIAVLLYIFIDVLYCAFSAKHLTSHPFDITLLFIIIWVVKVLMIDVFQIFI